MLIKEFCKGEEVILSVEGEVTEGCRFMFYPEYIQCCYSFNESLCTDDFKSASNCSTFYDFSVEESKGEGCRLLIQDFQDSFQGEYSVVDPGNPNLNQDFKVSTSSDCVSLVAVIVPIVIVLLVIFLGILFRFGYWPRGREKRRERDGQIIGGLLRGDPVERNDCVGMSRPILRVRDKDENTIYHVAAREEWTDEKTQILNQELHKQGNEIKGQEAGNPEVHTSDIYTVKIPPRLPFQKPKIDVNTKNKSGETPLHMAVCHPSKIQEVKALLKNGARIDIPDCNQATPLHRAVSKNNREIVELLLKGRNEEELKTLLNMKNDQDLTPMGIAVQGGFDLIKVTLVYSAIDGGHESTLVEILNKKGVDWREDWKIDGMTFLIKSFKDENVEAVRIVLDKLMFTQNDLSEALDMVDTIENEAKKNAIKEILSEAVRQSVNSATEFAPVQAPAAEAAPAPAPGQCTIS